MEEEKLIERMIKTTSVQQEISENNTATANSAANF
jgi:hypothetical protein